jgi:hypothetical protein
MPNLFASLDVPTSDATPGAPFDVTATGRPKTLVLDGAVRSGGRYIVEGSTNGGAAWDVLVGLDGTQGLFTTDNGGTKTIDAIVTHLRVRSEGNGVVTTPPSLTLGAPPAVGLSVFRDLPVPPANGPGPIVDLGDSAGPFKTIVLRQGAGPIPPGARYSILASMDGVKFDEALLYTTDRQGARPLQVMCRFMRVLRSAGGPDPIVAVGAEGLATGAAGNLCPVSGVSLEDERTVIGPEVLIAQWMFDFGTLADVGPTLGAVLSGLAKIETEGEPFLVRLYVGGTVGLMDGVLVGEVSETPGSIFEHPVSIRQNLPLPAGRQPVKVSIASPGVAHLRGLACQFTCPVS